MKKLILLLSIVMFTSCSEVYLVRYSVSGSTDARVTYLHSSTSVSEDITGNWSKDIYIKAGQPVGISALNNESSTLDVRVMFIGSGDWCLYEKKTGSHFVNIQGVIRSMF